MSAPQGARAIWVDATHLALPQDLAPEGARVRFGAHPELALGDLGPTGVEITARAPELRGRAWRVWAVEVADAPPPGGRAAGATGQAGALREAVAALLQDAPVVEVTHPDGRMHSTRTQIARALDDLYAEAADAPLGTQWDGRVPTLHLWAPTAVLVEVEVDLMKGQEPLVLPARRNAATGMWSLRGKESWYGAKYLWRVHLVLPEDALDSGGGARGIAGAPTPGPSPHQIVGAPTPTGVRVVNRVTDPCSVALSRDSRWSVLADPADPDGLPEEWQASAPPPLDPRRARSIWEVHIADFSARDSSVPAHHRGTYMAFTHPDSTGMRHLRSLAEAGLDTVHLLPTYDFATVIEDPDLRSFTREEELPPPPSDPASETPQQLRAQRAAIDSYNWGYDPWHWNVPEGSYATGGNQDGLARLREHRSMVAALHRAGLRVVLDVVHNHMNASGQDPSSVLDRVVPGYHHRLDADGCVQGSACNDDTATEHMMTGRMVLDSVLHWARHFRVDGFRFDLMGHLPLELMRRIRRALDDLDPDADGIDGRHIMLYGEGWDFGPVAGDALFVQARQVNLAGSGIGAFNDRLRDAVRGGGPFDEDQRALQGWATGLALAPNGIGGATGASGPDPGACARLGHLSDLVTLGMLGAPADLPILCHDGVVRKGRDISFRGAPAGWTRDPLECVNYVDAHDNETLFDALVWKLPVDTPMDQRIRVNTLALATLAWGQGICFWHAGTEVLRSKSLDRDSFDSGVAVNAVDWSLSTHGFGTGLPGWGKNGRRWDLMRPLLRNRLLHPSRADMELARDMALDLLRVRSSTPLFALGTGARVRERMRVPALEVLSGGIDRDGRRVPGVVALVVEDAPGGQTGQDLDPRVDSMLIALNPAPWQVHVRVQDLVGRDLRVHPLLAHGADPLAGQVAWEASQGVLSLPGRTASVLWEWAAGCAPGGEGEAGSGAREESATVGRQL
ncbi:DUF3372 domain-containing protein [Schaalia sp. 19OD2882]|uniref:alpha-1,6-glucosidase domain-containing protein n=1 Tax=Schaalia sp. 19OD2882 TaxID=2794089 RepID=UPI001C1ED48D|nr:alpha-1,6-glucosidase domain-containing protein [Schaalia sp. 19OD2882]QWW19234.1 DUF3372 domain-containing protein [Schaalia sp. 19OD2882]